MQDEQLDGLLLTAGTDIRYVSGFTGSNALAFITATAQHLFTDIRYELQAPAEAPGWHIAIAKEKTLLELLATSKHAVGCKTVGYDERTTSVAMHRNMRTALSGVKLKWAAPLLPALRAVKRPEEIASLRKAARLADSVFAEVYAMLVPGMAERDIATELRYRAALGGSEADPFPPIVVSGPRSALIHGKPSDRKLRRGDLVIIDFGCTVDGYCSDMTRTLAVGGISKEKRRMYDTVRQVQEATIAEAKSGMPADSLDAFARSGIRNAGYGAYFSHALGHGIGLDVHEDPKVSVKASKPLETGNVITIEPGIYIPARGGVRIEDDIVIGAKGPEILTKTTKELLFI